MRHTLSKRIFSIALTLIMCLSFIMIVPTDVNAASGKSYYLPVRYRTYKMVNGKWKKQSDYKYKYDSKGNLTKWAGSTLELKYKSGKLDKVYISGTTDEYDAYYSTGKEYKKGNIASLHFEGIRENGTGVIREYSYSYNKKGYISQRKNLIDNSVVKYTYKYYKSGIPSQITETYSYNGVKYKHVEKYNKDGMLISCKKYENGKNVSTLTEKITKSKGKITTVIETGNDSKGKVKVKCVFTYGKAKTTNKKKYISSMNMMMGGIVSQTIGDNPIVGYCYWN